VGTTAIEASEWSEKVERSARLVAVEFWHAQCPWCKKLAPLYEKVSEKFPEIDFLLLNALSSSENKGLAQSKGIMSTPTIKFYCNGIEIGEIIGFKPAEELEKSIEKIASEAKNCAEQSTRMQE
jgi:thiol-disulfide isomerase/thioredoxin